MIGIFLGLALLIFLAYKGYNIIWVAPLCALVVAVTGGLNLFEAYTVTYMEGLVGFAKSWFPVFLFGAVYGKLMEVTGQANAVAEKLAKLIGSKRAILAVIITCAVLTYGGVSLFVAVFAVSYGGGNVQGGKCSKETSPGRNCLRMFHFYYDGAAGLPTVK